MASQIVFVIASLCLWHRSSANITSSIDMASTPSVGNIAAPISATPALDASSMMTSSVSVVVLPPIVQPTSTAASGGGNTAVSAVSGGGSTAVSAVSGGGSTAVSGGGSTAVVVAPATSAAASATVNVTAIAPSSSTGSGTPATSIIGKWTAWVRHNCDATCCYGLASKKVQENRTCDTNVIYCPSDVAHARNLTREVDCPECKDKKCYAGSDAPNKKPWTVLLISVFMVALGFIFAH